MIGVESEPDSPFGFLEQRHGDEDLPLKVFLLIEKFVFLAFLEDIGHGLNE